MQRSVVALVLALTACGGKVVFVDEDGAGGDGAGGSSSSLIPGQGGSSSSTPPPPITGGSGPSGGAGPTVMCKTGACSVGQTSCSCLGDCSVCEGGLCSGALAEQTCSFTPEGLLCQCVLGGSLVGECSQIGSDCGLENGCCLAFYQGALN